MDNTMPLWSKFLFFTVVGCLAVEICYSNDHEELITIANEVLEVGMNPNKVIKEVSKSFDNCPHEGASALAPSPSVNADLVAKEKAEIAKIGCTRKFLEKSGLDYNDFKKEVQAKCKEEGEFVNLLYEFQTVYEEKRRYTYGCVAEIHCYEFKKGAWTSSPMTFNFESKVPVKGPLKP